MGGKTAKIAVDICMAIFLALSFVRWDGDPAFHFAVGVACALFFAIHVCIHRKWLKAVTKNCFAGKLNKAAKGKYVVDVFLLAVWSIVIITGFLAIGSYVGGISRMHVFSRIHGISARLGLLLIVFHVIQHRSQIVSYFRGKASRQNENKDNGKDCSQNTRRKVFGLRQRDGRVKEKAVPKLQLCDGCLEKCFASTPH